MLYKNDIKIIKIIRKSTPQLTANHYDPNDIWKSVHEKHPNIDIAKYLSTLDNLDSNGFISFAENTKTAFRLNDSGRYFYQYRQKQCLSYIADKWIDFFALTIAIIALIISVA